MSALPIDLDTLAALKETAGEEFVSELAQAFMDEAPSMLEDLRRALEARDADTFRRSAHSLKSNGNTFGALRLAAMARDLELGGLDRALDGEGPRLAALVEEYSTVAAALKELCHA